MTTKNYIQLMLLATIAACGNSAEATMPDAGADAAIPENTMDMCTDHIDNDNNGAMDADDPSCWDVLPLSWATIGNIKRGRYPVGSVVGPDAYGRIVVVDAVFGGNSGMLAVMDTSAVPGPFMGMLIRNPVILDAANASPVPLGNIKIGDRFTLISMATLQKDPAQVPIAHLFLGSGAHNYTLYYSGHYIAPSPVAVTVSQMSADYESMAVTVTGKYAIDQFGRSQLRDTAGAQCETANVTLDGHDLTGVLQPGCTYSVTGLVIGGDNGESTVVPRVVGDVTPVSC